MGHAIVVGAGVSTKPSVGIPIGDISEGSIVKLKEDGIPVEFYVAKHGYESGLNGNGKTLLVRKEAWSARKWHDYDVNAYASSSINTWLNNTYKNKFDDYAKTAMGTTKFYYTPGNGNAYVSSLTRSVFLLSVYELTGGDYGSVNQEGAVLPIYSILQDDGQWTRSPNTGHNNSAEIVSSGSSVVARACSTTAPFRPCFTIPSNSLFDEKTMIFKRVA